MTRKPTAVTEDDIMATLSRLSGIPVEKMTQADSKKYLTLEKELHKRVIGQDAAISAISRAIRRNQAGIRTGKRPIGSFMFLGPTGVGKTELAKALAELLFDDESALIRFDMSEYMENLQRVVLTERLQDMLAMKKVENLQKKFVTNLIQCFFLMRLKKLTQIFSMSYFKSWMMAC